MADFTVLVQQAQHFLALLRIHIVISRDEFRHEFTPACITKHLSNLVIGFQDRPIRNAGAEQPHLGIVEQVSVSLLTDPQFGLHAALLCLVSKHQDYADDLAPIILNGGSAVGNHYFLSISTH